jgi:hypothetical protein
MEGKRTDSPESHTTVSWVRWEVDLIMEAVRGKSEIEVTVMYLGRGQCMHAIISGIVAVCYIKTREIFELMLGAKLQACVSGALRVMETVDQHKRLLQQYMLTIISCLVKQFAEP